MEIRQFYLRKDSTNPTHEGLSTVRFSLSENLQISSCRLCSTFAHHGSVCTCTLYVTRVSCVIPPFRIPVCQNTYTPSLSSVDHLRVDVFLQICVKKALQIMDQLIEIKLIRSDWVTNLWFLIVSKIIFVLVNTFSREYKER